MARRPARGISARGRDLKLRTTSGPPPLLCPRQTARACSTIRSSPGCSNMHTMLSKSSSGLARAIFRRKRQTWVNRALRGAGCEADLAAAESVFHSASNSSSNRGGTSPFCRKNRSKAKVRRSTTSSGSLSWGVTRACWSSALGLEAFPPGGGGVGEPGDLGRQLGVLLVPRLVGILFRPQRRGKQQSGRDGSQRKQQVRSHSGLSHELSCAGRNKGKNKAGTTAAGVILCGSIVARGLRVGKTASGECRRVNIDGQLIRGD